MFDNLTTVTQGSIGLTQAIATFTRLGYVVSLPLIDNQSYDLVAEKDGVLQRVQVKTTRQKSLSGNFVVELKRVRANRTTNVIYKFGSDSCEILYVMTSEGDQYIIPSDKVEATCSCTLGTKYTGFKL